MIASMGGAITEEIDRVLLSLGSMSDTVSSHFSTFHTRLNSVEINLMKAIQESKDQRIKELEALVAEKDKCIDEKELKIKKYKRILLADLNESSGHSKSPRKRLKIK